MARENDLEGQQDMGGKHGDQAGMKPEDRSAAQQGIVRDEKGQEQPAGKAWAQSVSREGRDNDSPGDSRARRWRHAQRIMPNSRSVPALRTTGAG